MGAAPTLDAASEGAQIGLSFTSLDTTASSCTHPMDPAWIHAFRYLTAEHLSELWPKKAESLRDCGEKPLMYACGACGTFHVFPHRCRGRTCPICAPRAAAAIAERMLERIAVHDRAMESEKWDGPGNPQKRSWRMVTLTSPALPDEGARWDPVVLRLAVKAFGDALPKWWRKTWGRQVRDKKSRSKRARRDTSAVVALEVAPGGMVHAHFLVYGEFKAQATVQKEWEKALGVPLAIVDVRSVGQDLVGGIREALKYATKGTGPDQAKRAAAVEFAFMDRKRIRLYGALRMFQGQSEEVESEDAQDGDVQDHQGTACEACGFIGKWVHIGPQYPACLTRNDGWGRLKEDRRYERKEGIP